MKKRRDKGLYSPVLDTKKKQVDVVDVKHSDWRSVLVSVASSFDGLFRLTVFVLVSVLMLVQIVEYRYFMDKSWTRQATILFETVAGMLLMQEMVAPFVPGDVYVSYDMTLLGSSRVPQSVAVGVLMLMVTSIRSKVVNLFLTDYFDSDLTALVVDARIILFILAFIHLIYGVVFYVILRSRVSGIPVEGSPDVLVRYVGVPRYYDGVELKRAGWLDVVYTLSHMLCLCVLLMYHSFVLRYYWDAFVALGTLYNVDMNEVVVINVSTIVVLSGMVGLYILRYVRGDGYVVHTAELLVLVYVIGRLINDAYEVSIDDPNAFGIDSRVDTVALVSSLVWLFPLGVSFIGDWNVYGRVSRNVVDMSEFVMSNVVDLDKWSRFLFALSVVTSWLGLMMVIGSVTGDMLSVDFEPGPVIVAMEDGLRDISDVIDDVLSFGLSAVEVLNPCTRAPQDMTTVSGSGLAPTDPDEDVTFPDVDAPGDPMPDTREQQIIHLKAATTHYDSCFDGNAFKPVGSLSSECLDLKSTMDQGEDNRQIAENRKTALVDKYSGTEPTFYDQECLNIQCGIIIGVVSAAVAAALIPFVNIGAVPIQIATRVARMVFKLGLRLAKGLKKLYSKRSILLRFMRSVAKVSVKGIGKLEYSRTMLLVVSPLVVLMLVGFALGFWRRRYPRTVFNSILFAVFFTVLMLGNGLFYFILTEVPIIMQETVDNLPAAVVGVDITEGGGWLLIRYGYLASTINSGVWVVLALFSMLDTLWDDIYPMNGVVSRLRHLGGSSRLERVSLLRDVKPSGKAVAPVKKSVAQQMKQGVSQQLKMMGSGDWFSATVIGLVGLYFFFVTFINKEALFHFRAFRGNEGATMEKDTLHSGMQETESESMAIGSGPANLCDLFEIMVKEIVNAAMEGMRPLAQDMHDGFKSVLYKGEEFLKAIGSDALEGALGFVDLHFDTTRLMIVILYSPTLIVNIMMVAGSAASILPDKSSRRVLMGFSRSLLIPLQVTSISLLLAAFGVTAVFDSVQTPVFSAELTIGDGFINCIYANCLNVLAITILYVNAAFHLESVRPPSYFEDVKT